MSAGRAIDAYNGALDAAHLVRERAYTKANNTWDADNNERFEAHWRADKVYHHAIEVATTLYYVPEEKRTASGILHAIIDAAEVARATARKEAEDVFSDGIPYLLRGSDAALNKRDAAYRQADKVYDVTLEKAVAVYRNTIKGKP